MIRINSETNMWEVSYDNGTTWVSLGVKAVADVGETDHSTCEHSGWQRFWRGIGNFFRRMFGMRAKCYCGEYLEKGQSLRKLHSSKK